MKNLAAIILAAGRGTRMNDNSHNKVCFECAGVPVIRRLVLNMQEAGIRRFVVVVGHMAQDVMNALDGISGIVFVYQKVQNGTGSAARLGLQALKSTGYSGPVIISMGDKLSSPAILKDYAALLPAARAVYGVQKTGINPSGGRIAYRKGKAFGIVEFADASLLKVWPHPRDRWMDELTAGGMSESKAAAALKRIDVLAEKGHWYLENGKAYVRIAGEPFSADDLLQSPYTNVALYGFDADEALLALQNCTPQNAQGEIYLTETMEYFSGQGEVTLYPVQDPGDIATYSTKPELIQLNRAFMRTAHEMAEAAEGREKQLLEAFMARFGDSKVVVTRAPGRVNILGRHIDHRGGCINVLAIDRDSRLAVSPRNDRTVQISNTNPQYGDDCFDIDELMALAPCDDWIRYIESDAVRREVSKNQGAWGNYIRGAVARFQCISPLPLCGMNIMMQGNIPAAAGLSSSSSIVVAISEAIAALNCLNLSTRQFIDLCGEGEWFVGTRGGAGDHAAMKCSEAGRITQLGFKPFYVGNSEVFSRRYAVIVANSSIRSNKAEGSRDTFNAKVAAYEISFMLMKRYFPEYNMNELRDAAAIRPYSDIYKMLKRLPEKATREEILELLPENRKRLEQIFSSHADPGIYDLRGVALFGISECARSKICPDYLEREDYTGLGQLMKISQNGDRVTGGFPLRITDEYLIRCAEKNADVAFESGAYACSVPEIDALCDMLDATDGVLGSQMLGAGLGGCLAALVEEDKAEAVIEKLNTEYYDKIKVPHQAMICRPGRGSSVTF